VIGQIVILRGTPQRELAKRMIDAAPPDHEVHIRPRKRSLDQNARLHAHLTDIARQMAGRGKVLTVDQWKVAFLYCFGWEVEWIEGPGGERIPYGLKTSRLSKRQCADFITYIEAWSAENGITLHDREAA
jgi:hypothetical protein